MEIQRFEDATRGSFFVEKDQEKLARMTYSKAGADKIIIDHTEVDPSLKGEGVGRKLVFASVKYARENGLKIIPLCPFAKAEFEKNADYADVLAW
jgi:predicted GNAT family acetyltransferase